jgi:hypothetical protein
VIELGASAGDALRRDETSGAWVPDRSRADFAVVMALVEGGASDDEIRAVFEGYPEGIGERYDEIGERADAYLRRTITRARELSVAHTRVAARIAGVYVSTSDGRTESVRMRLEPAAFQTCAPGGSPSAPALPAYLTVYASQRSRWEALFDAAGLVVPDPTDVHDTQRQAFGLNGEVIALELDDDPQRANPVRRILAADGAA